MKQQQAWELFKGGTRMKGIAEALGVHRKTISRWAKADRWNERLEAIQDKATIIRDKDAVGKTVELLSKVDDSLGYVLNKVPDSRTRDLANTARAADHLSKTRERLRGKSPDGEEGRPQYGASVTIQNIILAARGGAGAPQLDPMGVRYVLETLSAAGQLRQLIEAGCRPEELKRLAATGVEAGYDALTQCGIVALARPEMVIDPDKASQIDPLELKLVAMWATEGEEVIEGEVIEGESCVVERSIEDIEGDQESDVP